MNKTKKLMTLFLVLTVLGGIAAYRLYPTAHGTSPPIIAVNGPSSPCMNSGTQFTTSITASNMTNTMSWQLNVTFVNITPINFTFGSRFPPGQYGVSAGKNYTGTYLVGFGFYNGASPLTTTAKTTLVTFAWQATYNSAPISIHIVPWSQNPGLGSELLDPSNNQLAVNTSDFFGCGTPNLNLPLREGLCLSSGATLTETLTASNLTSVNSWQVNVTWTSYPVVAKSFTMGTSFTGSNTVISNSTNNGKGWFLLKFNFTNGASVTTTSQITLVSISWKTTQYHAFAVFHIVLSTENLAHGTYLWNTTHQTQQYTTSDGDLSCQV